MRCDKCDTEVPDDEIFVHAGRNLCEDCYISVMARPKPCDPGAVSAARASRELQGQQGTQGLTPVQRKLYDYLKDRGKAKREEVAAYMDMPMEDLEGVFAVMRHMCLVRGFKEDDTIFFTLM